ncbi:MULTISPECIES: PLP-dependent transferase [unclassified Polaribacter]|uniref:PLP-dependent transferase n=1 Tax=unclassified Polaribacter TaxID=196858 RepID=UPI0011BFDB8D|nr:MULTISPECIES: PLP-dependent transferase [unclassified Polaribacter]TXD52191.1 cystathionine beta-synthase [Polaribacter sp. IC063]TXD60095.1 cystathionine beta-synthase [Polaribacter sp. IC066]
MQENKIEKYIKVVLENMPTDWLHLTTHRLDIYDEKLAKNQFLNHFETLFQSNNAEASALHQLPTAYDYIRLGHPLSCVLEWAIAHINHQKPENIISFSSQTMPILAILRKNLLENKNTQILYTDEIPDFFDAEILKNVYDYKFDVIKIDQVADIAKFNGSTILLSNHDDISSFDIHSNIDFLINLTTHLGSVLLINGEQNENYISDIQHVRRRETIAMTPSNALIALQYLIEKASFKSNNSTIEADKKSVLKSIKEITGTTLKPLVASSGLSIQYPIMMGLIHDAQENHAGKAIKFIVPPNCYGGTNDQARRVAACLDHVEIVDLPVDGDNEMVQSIENILAKIAHDDAVPYIIAEIPTNPRVEVPNLIDLKNTLRKKRTTANGEMAIDPVFILDQTFCPNIHFLGKGEILSTIRTISYASGSKFPSGGKCTAGYCVGNDKTASLMEKIEIHLQLCDNEATHHQMAILAKQLPSMNQRIHDAYKNTREFVNFIGETLPAAKINFVSEELAAQEITPSVFSLDLPTKGNTDAEKETYKRALNLKLINLMIAEIPDESKFCVSYGQLNGCYWTIPATSTQGTTKEGDKDYIVRASLSPNMDLELHKKVFLKFVEGI